MTTGQRIRQLREEKGWSQGNLLVQLHKTIDSDDDKVLARATLSRYENDIRAPTQWVLIALAEVLDTTTDYLLCLSDEPHPQPESGQSPYADLTQKLNALAADTRAQTLTTFFSILDLMQMDPEEAYRISPDPRSFLDLLSDEEFEELEAMFLERHRDKKDDT